MARKVVTVEMDDTLMEIREIFHKAKFHHLLVVNDDKLMGIISDRDVLKATSPNINTISETTRDRATLNKRAHQIMTRNPITIRGDATLEEAAEVLLEERISCLPIIDFDHHVMGLITWVDIIKAFLQQTVQQTVESPLLVPTISPHSTHAVSEES